VPYKIIEEKGWYTLSARRVGSEKENSFWMMTQNKKLVTKAAESLEKKGII